LYGATCFWRHHEEKEMDSSVSQYTVCCRPVPHGEGISVPETPKEFTFDSDDEDEGESTRVLSRRRLLSHTSATVGLLRHSHTYLTQEELNDLVRYLELSKSKAELPGSRLKRWNLLEKNVRMSSFRSRHQQLVPLFREEDNFVFCYDVDGLVNALGIKQDPQEWRLFIDPTKLSLKAVLLHNGNQHPSIPVGQSVHMKETYENIKQLLNKLGYSKYGWHSCGDLKVVSLLMGLQLGCTKYCCFLCEWDSRAKTLQYLKRETGLRRNV